MAYRDSPFQQIKAPLVWMAGAATVVAAVLAVVLLVADRRDHVGEKGYGEIRGVFDSVLAPTGNLTAAPVRWISFATDEVRGYFFAVSENRRLKQQVAELQRWRDAAIALKNINDRYESLLKLRTEPAVPMISARVVVDARGPFANARLADAGTQEGVSVGNPVMSDHGLVGRVIGAAPHASRILLLTDVDAKTPVLVDRTNARAILTGDGGAAPRLDYLRGRDPIREGDMILTSGDGGIYPRGLPVGVAVKDFSGAWRVRLYADQAAIDYVRILQFRDLSQIVDPATLAPGAPPPLNAQQQQALNASYAQIAANAAARAAAAKAGAPPGAAPQTPAASTAVPESALPAAAVPTPKSELPTKPKSKHGKGAKDGAAAEAPKHRGLKDILKKFGAGG